MLIVIVVQLDVAAGKVGDRHRRDHRFVGDVLEPLEFQVHLDLPSCAKGKQNQRERDVNRIMRG